MRRDLPGADWRSDTQADNVSRVIAAAIAGLDLGSPHGRTDAGRPFWVIRERIPFVGHPVAAMRRAEIRKPKKDPKEMADPEEGDAAKEDEKADPEMTAEGRVVHGIASSTSVDSYGTEMSRACLEDQAVQFSEGVAFLPSHGSMFGGPPDWDEVMGYTNGATLEDGRVANPYDKQEPGAILSVDAPLYDFPMCADLLMRIDEEQPIGLSIGGWFEEVRIITNDEDEVERAIVERVTLDHVAVTRMPANPDAMGLARGRGRYGGPEARVGEILRTAIREGMAARSAATRERFKEADLIAIGKEREAREQAEADAARRAGESTEGAESGAGKGDPAGRGPGVDEPLPEGWEEETIEGSREPIETPNAMCALRVRDGEETVQLRIRKGATAEEITEARTRLLAGEYGPEMRRILHHLSGLAEPSSEGTPGAGGDVPLDAAPPARQDASQESPEDAQSGAHPEDGERATAPPERVMPENDTNAAIMALLADIKSGQDALNQRVSTVERSGTPAKALTPEERLAAAEARIAEADARAAAAEAKAKATAERAKRESAQRRGFAYMSPEERVKASPEIMIRRLITESRTEAGGNATMLADIAEEHINLLSKPKERFLHIGSAEDLLRSTLLGAEADGLIRNPFEAAGFFGN
jgi:hypothetical protein